MICPTVSDLHFLLHINPFLASTRWTQPTSSPSFLYPFFHLRWKMSFCWCSPIFYRMYCQSSVSFCPYRISFGSVVRPQCYDFINQIKYILCRRERTSIVPNTSHTHRHTCPMIWCGAQLMFILMSQPRLIDSNADGPDQFEMWSSITSIRRFISQSQYSISASLVSIILKLSNSSIDIQILPYSSSSSPSPFFSFSTNIIIAIIFSVKQESCGQQMPRIPCAASLSTATL